MMAFLDGKDVFALLLTDLCKTLIYRVAPLVLIKLSAVEGDRQMVYPITVFKATALF